MLLYYCIGAGGFTGTMQDVTKKEKKKKWDLFRSQVVNLTFDNLKCIKLNL